MTTVIFLTVVFCAVAVLTLLKANKLAGKAQIAACVLAGVFLTLMAGGLASDVQGSLVTFTEGAGNMIAGLFS